MIFNKSRKYDFPPEFSFSNDKLLECVEETKLLGILLNPSLKWESNTQAVCVKAMSKMWLIRRMKNLNLDPDIIADYYLKEIRSLTEQGVVVWNSGLTKSQINDLEKIQKVALKIILGDDYNTYDLACAEFNLDQLSLRRTKLCTTFAVKLYKSDRCDQFFTPYSVNTRSFENKLVRENYCRTTRCYNAPHNYLTRLVNENKDRIEKSQKQ